VDLFDGCVAPLLGFDGEHRAGRVGEHGMVAPEGEQFALGVARDVFGILVRTLRANRKPYRPNLGWPGMGRAQEMDVEPYRSATPQRYRTID
jgi:hypothetical protein